MRRLLLNTQVLIGLFTIGGLLAVALWPRAALIEMATVTRGPLIVTVDEEGVTRVRERFVVSSPVAGRVLRIELDPGDAVKRGQGVVQLRAEAAPLLDERARAEAQAAVESAKAVQGRARAEEQRARATVAQLERDLTRVRELAHSRLIAARDLDTQEAQLAVANESLTAATFAVQAATSDLQRAESRLMPTTTQGSGRVVRISSPVSGVVLKRLRESESIVPAGDPLLEIGDPTRLEIVSDLLSTDAVRVTPGSRAIIEQWGGDSTLDAIVRRVEPAGFTKISAVGVEEQRVNVVLDFVDPTCGRGLLGDAYRVEVRIVVWEAQEVVKVPTSALFRDGEQWAVYRVVEERARRTAVVMGHQNGQEAEITTGLIVGDRVVVHPADTLKDGARVSAVSR
jgi:HlyD family secretion protein